MKQIRAEPAICIFSRVPLERDNSEEFLKREARASQLAEEIEASASYKARVALENDERSEEEKYTAVMRGERDPHTLGRWECDLNLDDLLFLVSLSTFLYITFQ